MEIVTSNWIGSFWDKLEPKLHELDNNHIEYGYYPDDYHQGSGLPMGSLAAIQEMGSESQNIPSRPFLLYSAYLIDEVDKNIFSRSFVNIVYKNRGEMELKKLGRAAVKAVHRSIDSQNFEPLAESTVAKKNSTVILIDTEELYHAARFKIVSGEEDTSLD